MERLPNEPQDAYRARRAARDANYARRLLPRMVHVSSEPVALAPGASNATLADWKARCDRGQIRDVKERATPAGVFLVGRTKGTTYRRPKAQ